MTSHHVLLGCVPNMAASVDTQQTISDSDVMVHRLLLVAKVRVRQPQVVPLAFRHLYLF